MRVDTGLAEGDAIPAEFDSTIAKLIAWGRDRDEAIARLRCAIAETVIVVEGGTTNQGFLLDLLDRPELRSGDVDTTWLDRMQLKGDIVAVRHADVAILQAAIEISQAETAAERARFYAFARRGRPQADAATERVVELRHRGHAYPCTVSQIAGDRHRVIWRRLVDVGVQRVGASSGGSSSPAPPTARLSPSTAPTCRSRSTASASHRPRRRRDGPQPGPGHRRLDPRRAW